MKRKDAKGPEEKDAQRFALMSWYRETSEMSNERNARVSVSSVHQFIERNLSKDYFTKSFISPPRE